MPVGAASAPEARGAPQQRQGAEDTETARLTAAWAREAPAARDWRQMPTAPADDDECPDCGEAMLWHSAHTALVCLGCELILEAPSPHVTERAEAHAAAIARKRAGVSREVAVIDPAAEARARAARVDLHRNREMVQKYARDALTWCDEDYQRSQFQRRAHEIGATIRGYLPEIATAPDNPMLAAVLGELRAIRNSAEFAELVAESERQDEEAERAEAYARRAAEVADIEAERTAALTRALAERQAAEAREIAAQQQRRQLPAAPIRKPPSPTALGLIQIADAIGKQRAARQAAIAQNGTCGFCRKPTAATRVYGIAAPASAWAWGATQTAQLDTRAESIRACAKHYGAASNWITQRYPGGAAYWWES